MEQFWGGVLIFLLCGVFLAVGFTTGRLPNQARNNGPERHGLGFWALVALYLFGALAGLYVAVTNYPP